MAIKGSLREASLPDVIQLLYLGRRTGCLAVADRQSFGYIWFDEGMVCHASIVNRRDRLGDILVKRGRITPEQLAHAVELQATGRERRLGEILVETRAITREELAEYVRIQVEEAVYFLFTWTSGTFNFEAGIHPESEDMLAPINPEHLLLEGARRVDEWSLIEKKIPSFDLIFEADQAYVADSQAELSAAQRQLLPLVDGSRDVQQLVEDSGLVEFEAGKALYGLITAGFARRVGTSATAATPRVNDARVEEHRNLGVAFYKAGMFEEAVREFRRVAELRPAEGGAPFFLGLVALRQARWADAVELFRQALDRGGPRPAALHNLGLALEQLGRLDEAEQAWADAAGRARDDARVATGWGIAALKRGDWTAARSRLERARELHGDRTPSALWFWAATLAAGGEGDDTTALELARTAADTHPSSAPLRNNLGVLLELGGDGPAADEQYRAAFTEEPTLPQASKNLADLLYRAGRYEEATETYERAAKLAPDLGDDLYFKLGNIAYKRRDLERARSCWSRATELNPGHQLARANLEMLSAAG